MYQIIPFAEIDKNKWNGTIHYALNGNSFGYYWYLKAVVNEWDAIIENDYETVMPVIKQPILPYQHSLLRELGPYSVNALSDDRLSAILDLYDKSNKSHSYALNSSLTLNALPLIARSSTINYKAIYLGGKSYEHLSKSYSDDFKNNLITKGFENITIVSSIKPEIIVVESKLPANHQNALMRIMYNAIHRGLGFTSGLLDTITGKYLAMSFWISTNDRLTELITISTNKKYRLMVIDLLLRNNSERRFIMECYEQVDDMTEIGFDIEPIHVLQSKMTLSQTFTKMIRGY